MTWKPIALEITTTALFTVLVALTAPALANEGEISDRTRYSAVESLHAAMARLYANAGFMQLLREFDQQGDQSSIQDVARRLVALATAHGLYAKQVHGLTVADLRSLRSPIILRVRPAIEVKEADHYILLKDIEGDKAQITARGHDSLRAPLQALAALWGGSGIILSQKPIAVGSWQTSDFLFSWRWIATAILAAAALFGGAVWHRRFTTVSASFRRTGLQTAVLLLVAAGLGMSSWLFGPARSMAVAGHQPFEQSILIDFRDKDKPVAVVEFANLSAEEMRQLVETKEVLFVDARMQKPYDARHVKGAINLPRFDASTIRLRLAGVPKDQLIVVYCVNINCGRGRAAAGALVKAGFTRVMHYPPGWAELKNWDELQFTGASSDESSLR